jgi:anti-sigma-K factor RskA
MTGTGGIGCAQVDELAAAFAVGAVDATDERAIHAHLAACGEPHGEVRAMIEGASVLAASIAPVAPSLALRDRLMATVAATPQDHALPQAATAVDPLGAEPRRPWWQLGSVPGLAAAAVVAVAVGLGAWGLAQQNQLAERDAWLRTIAAADAAYPASGSAGRGWLLESDGRALFLADTLADLPAGRLYALWLIGPDGAPQAVGTLEETDRLAVVTLGRGLESATTFAVTVEAGPVAAPSGEPVLVASLDG